MGTRDVQSFREAARCLALHVAVLPELLGSQRGGWHKPPTRQEGPAATFSDELGRGSIGRKEKETEYVIGEENVGRAEGL